MFSPLVKGNGTWDGRLEVIEDDLKEPSFDVLFPSISKAPTHETLYQKTNHHRVSPAPPENEHFQCIELPKTFLTRKGAIVLFAPQKQQKEHENKRLQHIVIENPENCAHSDKQRSPSPENDLQFIQQVQKTKDGEPSQPQAHSNPRRKIFIDFLQELVRKQKNGEQDTLNNPNEESISGHKRAAPRDQNEEEDHHLTLSRPKTISSFFHRHSPVSSKTFKLRPKTVCGIPPEPEQPKAHPRITSAKPSPPTRALGKIAFKNVPSKFEQTITSHLDGPEHIVHPSSPDLEQDGNQRPHSQATTYLGRSSSSQRVKDGSKRSTIPRHNHVSKHGDSRASTASRYSAWWLVDDVSFSHYDNDIPNQSTTSVGDNPVCPEIMECLARDRSSLDMFDVDATSRPVSSICGSTWEVWGGTGTTTGYSDYRDGDTSKMSSRMYIESSLSRPMSSVLDEPGTKMTIDSTTTNYLGPDIDLSPSYGGSRPPTRHDTRRDLSGNTDLNHQLNTEAITVTTPTSDQLNAQENNQGTERHSVEYLTGDGKKCRVKSAPLSTRSAPPRQKPKFFSRRSHSAGFQKTHPGNIDTTAPPTPPVSYHVRVPSASASDYNDMGYQDNEDYGNSNEDAIELMPRDFTNAEDTTEQPRQESVNDNIEASDGVESLSRPMSANSETMREQPFSSSGEVSNLAFLRADSAKTTISKEAFSRPQSVGSGMSQQPFSSSERVGTTTLLRPDSDDSTIALPRPASRQLLSRQESVASGMIEEPVLGIHDNLRPDSVGATHSMQSLPRPESVGNQENGEPYSRPESSSDGDRRPTSRSESSVSGDRQPFSRPASSGGERQLISRPESSVKGDREPLTRSESALNEDGEPFSRPTSVSKREITDLNSTGEKADNQMTTETVLCPDELLLGVNSAEPLSEDDLAKNVAETENSRPTSSRPVSSRLASSRPGSSLEDVLDTEDLESSLKQDFSQSLTSLPEGSNNSREGLSLEHILDTGGLERSLEPDFTKSVLSVPERANHNDSTPESRLENVLVAGDLENSVEQEINKSISSFPEIPNVDDKRADSILGTINTECFDLPIENDTAEILTGKRVQDDPTSESVEKDDTLSQELKSSSSHNLFSDNLEKEKQVTGMAEKHKASQGQIDSMGNIPSSTKPKSSKSDENPSLSNFTNLDYNSSSTNSIQDIQPKSTKPDVSSIPNFLKPIDNSGSNSTQIDENSRTNSLKPVEDSTLNSRKPDWTAKTSGNLIDATKRKETATKAEKAKLDVQGVGKAETEDNEVTEKVDVIVKTKVDLSDLINKNNTIKTKQLPQKPKTKKSKSPKRSRGKLRETEDVEPTLDVIPGIDENLLKVLETNADAAFELSEEALNQFAPIENFEDAELLALPEERRTDAHSPSKVKKSSKKGKGRNRKDKTPAKNIEAEERKRKIAEEKERQKEELRLLKEREEEQNKLLEEVRERQRTIQEEREKRLEQEAQARQLEEDAEAQLREARRKAKEERERKREEDAERRRKEVQRKREEKRKRELEIQEREKEVEKQRWDREARMAELQARREREKELERMAEEQQEEEERLRLLELEEERKLEEERIKEAEEALQRLAREREYREQMRKIAEAQQAKLERQETERQLREQEERKAIEEERKRLEDERLARENEERERIRQLRQQEAIARIRAAHEASKRRAWALRRREKNLDRMAHLKSTRQSQKITEAFTFSYHVHVPRKVWELPYNWNDKKKVRMPVRKKK